MSNVDPSQAVAVTRRMQDLPLSERPYEKFARSGAQALSDAELLAILLRSGTPGQSALDLAVNLLQAGEEPGRGLMIIQDLSYEELCTLPGIGKVKGMQLCCVAEIAKRMQRTPAQTEARPLLNTPDRVYNWLAPQLAGEAQECLVSLLLDTRNRIIRTQQVSKGSLSELVITPREVFREAVRANAAGIILAHNHPSGDPKPSDADLHATAEMLTASKLMGIHLQDHLVIGRGSYVSIRTVSKLWQQ